MKTTNIVNLTLIAALIMGGLIFNSCSKEEMGGQTTARNNHAQMTPGDQAVYHSIMNFKKKVEYIKENPAYKSGETTSIDSAVWYLDATVNFTHAYNFESFDDFHTDSVFIDIPVSSGEIDMVDLSNAYFVLVDKIRDSIYSVVQDNDKQLYSSSTTLSTQAGGTVQLKSTATIGSKTIEPGTEEPFNEGWRYGEEDGSCLDTTNGSDAIHEIADAILSYKYLYLTDEGANWHAYYTTPAKEVDVYSHHEYEVLPGVDLLINPDDITPNDNDRDKLMFYQFNVNGPLVECIPADDMNFYYHGTHKVIYEIMPDNAGNIPDWNGIQGLTFNDITYRFGWHTGTQYNKSKLFHQLRILYKTRHLVYDDEYPKPL